MKKLIPIVIALAALVLIAAYYVSGKSADEGDISKSEEIITGIPADWQNYENTEYGFALSYPNDWEAQEALKPQELRAEHEVVFWEREYDMWRGSATVRVFPNEKQQTIREWWNNWLRDEDAKEAECRAEYGEESPCLFLRGLLEWEETTELAGGEAIVVGLFRFDHEEECLYVAQGVYVYGFCAAGANNPNDPKATEHKAITDTIRDSFKLF